jgi:hypothetical protein
MKTKTYVAVCWAMLGLSSGVSRAQESSRVPDTNPDAGAAVDASPHSGVDEQTAQSSDRSQERNKRPMPYSRWGVRSANRPSATRFHPDQTTGLPASAGTDDTPSTTLLSPLTRSEIPPGDILHHGQGTPARISSITGTADPRSANVRALPQNLNSETGKSNQDLNTRNPWPSPYRRNNSFSTPIHKKSVEPTEDTLFPSVILKSGVPNSTLLKVKPQKRNPPKAVNRSKPASSLGRQVTKPN